MNDDAPPLFILELMAAAEDALSSGPSSVPSARRRAPVRNPILADIDPHIEPRARRGLEDSHKIVNSLLIGGDIVQIEVGRWMIPQNAFTAPRDPLETDDRTIGVRVGSLFVNTATQTAWVNVLATENHAVWNRLDDSGDGLTGVF